MLPSLCKTGIALFLLWLFYTNKDPRYFYTFSCFLVDCYPLWTPQRKTVRLCCQYVISDHEGSKADISLLGLSPGFLSYCYRSSQIRSPCYIIHLTFVFCFKSLQLPPLPVASGLISSLTLLCTYCLFPLTAPFPSMHFASSYMLYCWQKKTTENTCVRYSHTEILE